MARRGLGESGTRPPSPGLAKPRPGLPSVAPAGLPLGWDASAIPGLAKPRPIRVKLSGADIASFLTGSVRLYRHGQGGGDGFACGP